MKRLYIDESFTASLADQRLNSFDALRFSDIPGVVIDEDRNRSVRRVMLAGTCCYLKRVHKHKLNSALEALARLSLPHHYCWREMQHIHYLRLAGIATMDVLAAGESTLWGVPNSSFILTREVQGEPLDKMFETLGEAEKEGVLQRLGQLVGKLHSLGFFAPVRMKDLICNHEGEFVLIDRETRNPRPGKFSSAKAVNSLKKTQYRQSRDNLRWTPEQLDVFLTSYLLATNGHWSISLEALHASCMA